MKLRWFVVCDKNGVKTEPELQYWDDDYGEWRGVSIIECKAWDEGEYIQDPDAY